MLQAFRKVMSGHWQRWAKPAIGIRKRCFGVCMRIITEDKDAGVSVQRLSDLRLDPHVKVSSPVA